MDILFVATELAPLVKVGGLADVIGALSKALRMLGHRVTVALPRFSQIEEAGVLVARRLTPLTLTGADGAVDVTVFDGRLGSGVELVLLDIPGEGGKPSAFFDRPGVYGEDGESYPDNARRFGLFCRAAVELVKARAAAGEAFDVVHVHDWPSAMVAYLLSLESNAPPSVLTIHNVAHQGVFGAADLHHFGLTADGGHFTPDRLEFYGSFNCLKGGIVAAGAVTTVSPTYAAEITTADKGEKLDGVLRARATPPVGILNGVDYAVWNAATDSAIAARFDAEDTANKGRCKAALCQEVGLSVDPSLPLVVFVGRTVPQKGADLLASNISKIARLDVNLAIAGSGDPKIERALTRACEKASDRAVYLGAVAEAVVHRLFAAADIVVVPSRFEPCGLVQLYAQRYGAIPVVCRTGGLADTVVDCDAQLETGTGFCFDGPTGPNMVGAMQRALAALKHPRWPALRRRVMRLDLGWDRPARRYAQLYQRAASS